MATALVEPEVSPRDSDLPPATTLSLVTGSSGQTDIEGTGAPVETKRIVVRELGIRPANQGGPFAYVTRTPHYNYTASALSTIITQLLAGQSPNLGDVAEYRRPLDLNLTEQTCFVLFLKPLREVGRDWRFSTDAKAITLGDFKTNATEKACYFDLHHVAADGSLSEAQHPPEKQCRIVYFFARLPPRTKFNHPININIEMYFDDDEDGKNTIPILIDPDVRYPGGSGA